MQIVSLPRSLPPRFPDRCVRCAGPRPGGHTRLVHFNGLRLYWVAVPVCRTCRPLLVGWLVWDHLRTLLIAGSAFAFGAIVLLPVLPGWAAGLSVLGLCVFGFVVVFLWNLRHPPAFNVDPGVSEVDYEFRADDLGREFALLNGAEEVARFHDRVG